MATETSTQAVASPDPLFTRNERPQKPGRGKRRLGPGRPRRSHEPPAVGDRHRRRAWIVATPQVGIDTCPLLVGTCTRGWSTLRSGSNMLDRRCNSPAVSSRAPQRRGPSRPLNIASGRSLPTDAQFEPTAYRTVTHQSVITRTAPARPTAAGGEMRCAPSSAFSPVAHEAAFDYSPGNRHPQACDIEDSGSWQSFIEHHRGLVQPTIHWSAFFSR